MDKNVSINPGGEDGERTCALYTHIAWQSGEIYGERRAHEGPEEH